MKELSDEQLLRYNRQIMLPAFDYQGQQRLLSSRVLIIGLGGLGCPVALYLAASGVGKLILVDGDKVEVSNLQRQIAHKSISLGEFKVDSARGAIREINSDTEVVCINRYADDFLLNDLLAEVDAVVDCSDNFDTRFLLNRLAEQHAIPLISGAAVRMEGQVAVFDFRDPGSPCYACLYPPDSMNEGLTCSEAGVMSPLVGIIGSVQAMETIKVLSGMGETLNGKVLLLDAMLMQWRQLRLSKDPECPVCSQSAQ